MEIHYDPQLVEETVFQELARRERLEDLDLVRRFRSESDAIYERHGVGQREREFDRLHQTFFRLLGLDFSVRAVLTEFAEIKDKIASVLIGKAFTERDEAAELSPDCRNLGVKIRPRRFLDRPVLLRQMRHELMHVSDMLAEEFAYAYEGSLRVSSPMEESIVRDRYGLIWDIHVDGRLARQGKETVLGRDGRAREFGAVYAKIPAPQREAIFANLWQAESLTHHDILGMAHDAREVLARAGDALDDTAHEKILLSGSPCPLCRFPTYTWTEDLREQLPKDTLKLIQEDYPGWEPEEAACERCLEAYAVHAQQ
jgi:hypothetical protein